MASSGKFDSSDDDWEEFEKKIALNPPKKSPSNQKPQKIDSSVDKTKTNLPKTLPFPLKSTSQAEDSDSSVNRRKLHKNASQTEESDSSFDKRFESNGRRNLASKKKSEESDSSFDKKLDSNSPASKKKSEERAAKTDCETKKCEPVGDTELLVKPSCECPNCHHWTNSVDWCPTPNLEFENQDSKCRKAKQTQPLLKSAKYPGTKPKISSYESRCRSKIEKMAPLKTLVHGERIPEPINMFSDTYFNETIQLALQNLNYKHSLPVQAFAWPAILKQMNVFVISGRKSGKTMAYLPAVCSFAFQKEHRYQELSKYKGPVVVIVCPNSKHCEEIFDLVKKLYSKIHIKPKVCIMTYPVMNINNMDILITIPDTLVHCIISRIFNFKRLCHLVFESASALLKNDEENIYQILKVVNEMLEHRAGSNRVQLIVSSEKWSVDMKKLLKSIYVTPLVCIANYLEAALYGGIQFEVKFLMSTHKNAYVEGVLKNQYYLYKTLIICDNSEITELNKWLVRNGIETIALTDNSSREDIDECDILWNTAQGGQYKVVICTDFIFETLLSINDVTWLVHYSFPTSWTRFCKRFRALSSHYKSPLLSNEEKKNYYSKSYLIIDEKCEKEMPKILNFLSRLTKDLPETYKKYADGFKAENENLKIEKKVEICDNIKLFGKCSKQLCLKRHILNNNLDISDNLPKNGKIVFKILYLKDVTQYVIQLREHIDLNGQITKINTFDLKEPLVYSSDEEKKRVEHIEEGKFYAHCDNTTEGKVFMLCQVLKIENDTFVEVKLTTGVTIQTLHSKLYLPPTDLEIVDIFMCNLIPPHKDEYFSGRSYFVTRASYETFEYKDKVFTGDIHLQLDRTFWIDNVVETAKVGNSEVVKFNLTKHLMTLRVVEPYKSQLTLLHKLCEKCGITLPSYVKVLQKKPAKVKEVEIQRAFLDNKPQEVIFSSAVSPEEFYVRIAKFQDLLENLEKDLQKLVNTEVVDKNVNVAVGKYCLTLDPEEKMYSRALVLKIENDKALVYYVDYGDEAVKNISELKNLPSKYLTRLPFQAIQCRLHGLSPSFGEWEDEATDVLYKYLLEPDSDIFRSLYVKVCETENSDSIRTKFKYSVLLKDGYGERRILINQLLLDMGFATSIFNKIDDFDVPEFKSKKFYSDPDEFDSDFEDELIELSRDLEIHDPDDFFDLFFPYEVQQPQPRQQLQEEYETNENESNRSIEFNTAEGTVSEEKPTYLTPEVYWSQTDQIIKIKIKLVGVEEYKTNIIRKKIFTFCTNLEEKSYELKFTLHKAAKMSRHCAKGQEVEVILKKIDPTEWSQLTGGSKRLRNVHYEIPDEKEEPRRKFLQLDITDDESDNEDNIMIHEISDLDSEFDNEVAESSESD